jgi:hypothetical protein
MHNQLDSKDNYKAKNLKWGGMHRCLPLLKNGRKLVFLSFTNIDPLKLGSKLLARRRNHLSHNEM